MPFTLGTLKFISGNIILYTIFISQHWEGEGFFSFIVEDFVPLIQYNHDHGGWWCGDARSQAISRHGIVVVLEHTERKCQLADGEHNCPIYFVFNIENYVHNVIMPPKNGVILQYPWVLWKQVENNMVLMCYMSVIIADAS